MNEGELSLLYTNREIRVLVVSFVILSFGFHV